MSKEQKYNLMLALIAQGVLKAEDIKSAILPITLVHAWLYVDISGVGNLLCIASEMLPKYSAE